VIDLAIVGEANPLNVFESTDAIPKCKREKDGADSWNPDQQNMNKGRNTHKTGDGEAIALCEIVRAVTPACFQRLIRLLLIFLEEAQGVSFACVNLKDRLSTVISESDVTLYKRSPGVRFFFTSRTPGTLLMCLLMYLLIKL